MRFAVIENEFGEIGVDQRILNERVNDEIIEGASRGPWNVLVLTTRFEEVILERQTHSFQHWLLFLTTGSNKRLHLLQGVCEM